MRAEGTSSHLLSAAGVEAMHNICYAILALLAPAYQGQGVLDQPGLVIRKSQDTHTHTCRGGGISSNISALCSSTGLLLANESANPLW